jgi:hypothetical protein
MDIVKRLMELTEKEFDNPGWMDEFYKDVVKKKQFIVKVDDQNEISSFITFWRFGDKRWGYIRKINTADKCPKQMGKGKHLYVPLFWVRADRRGEINMKAFFPSLHKVMPDVCTISWHSGDKFITRRINEEIEDGN